MSEAEIFWATPVTEAEYTYHREEEKTLTRSKELV